MGGVSRQYHDQCFSLWLEITEYGLKPPARQDIDSAPSSPSRTPRQQNPNAPCTKFSNGTPELLAQVFLLLPQTDILCVAQQVCKQWKSVVCDTTSIQQYLFMKPLVDMKICLWGWAKGYKRPVGTQKQFNWGHPGSKDHSCTVLANPYLPLICSKAYLERDCMQRLGASWIRMMTSQPTIGWPMSMYEFSTYKEKRITASCNFEPVESYAHMLQVKKDWEMPHKAWFKLEERRAAEELPEYEVWEEMTGKRI